MLFDSVDNPGICIVVANSSQVICSRGICVLDVARTGVDLRAVANCHGVLTPPEMLP